MLRFGIPKSPGYDTIFNLLLSNKIHMKDINRHMLQSMREKNEAQVF